MVHVQLFVCVCVLSHVWLFTTTWTMPTRLLCPWEFPGKNTGEGCHFLLPGVLPDPRDQIHISCISCIGRQILYHSLLHLGNLVVKQMNEKRSNGRKKKKLKLTLMWRRSNRREWMRVWKQDNVFRAMFGGMLEK